MVFPFFLLSEVPPYKRIHSSRPSGLILLKKLERITPDMYTIRMEKMCSDAEMMDYH